MKTYTFRGFPQGNLHWYIGGVYAGKKGVLEWCLSLKDAIERANLMISSTTSKFDIKVMRLPI